MNKSWFAMSAGLLTVALFCVSCSKKQAPAQPSQEPNGAKAVIAAASPSERLADPNVVAVIGDLAITGDEFRRGFLQEMQPNPYSGNPIRLEPEPKAVILKMLCEKAMILDAKQRGVNKKDEIQATIKRTREQRVVGKLLMAVIPPRIVIKDQDVNDQVAKDPNLLAKDPNLARQRARTTVYNQKGNQEVSKYYAELTQNRHVKKSPQYFPLVGEINKRLLAKPKPGRQYWILNDEVKNDINPNEKALVLAAFDGGTFTVKDFFDALCDMAPPGRPKDLDNPQGVERFLDRAMSRPLLAVEATAQGYDKDPEVVKTLQKVEDDMVFSAVRQEKLAGVTEPNEQDVAAAYEKVKATYAKNDSLKAEFLWCDSRQAAAKAKSDLDGGKDFKAVQAQYSIENKTSQPGGPSVPPAGPIDTYMGQEGLFWPDLWKSEPNQVVGPMLGFRAGGLAWRIVKVLGKKEGTTAPPQNAMGMLKSDLQEQRQQAVMAKLGTELLARFPYQIKADRLAAFDPRNVP